MHPLGSLAALVLLVASIGGVYGCGSDSAGKNEAASGCGGIEAKLRQCGVLKPGTYDCRDWRDLDCSATCLAGASCTEIGIIVCVGVANPTPPI
jgi:hypothetical protein